jgi:hypothetical protein
MTASFLVGLSRVEKYVIFFFSRGAMSRLTFLAAVRFRVPAKRSFPQGL